LDELGPVPLYRDGKSGIVALGHDNELRSKIA
jgi:hypothetical protein